MELMENTKGMFVMENVHGQSLLSKQIIDYLANFSKEEIIANKKILKQLQKQLDNPSPDDSPIMLRDKISTLKKHIARKENIQSKLSNIHQDLTSGLMDNMTDYQLKKFLATKYEISDKFFVDFMENVQSAIQKLYPDKLE